MYPLESDALLRRIEHLVRRLEEALSEGRMHGIRSWRRRLLIDFFSGIVRGVGFSIGFSILGALLLYILRNIALSNLPVIGKFLAELVRIVENNL